MKEDRSVGRRCGGSGSLRGGRLIIRRAAATVGAEVLDQAEKLRIACEPVAVDLTSKT